jgi:hypothetical protein
MCTAGISQKHDNKKANSYSLIAIGFSRSSQLTAEAIFSVQTNYQSSAG